MSMSSGRLAAPNVSTKKPSAARASRWASVGPATRSDSTSSPTVTCSTGDRLEPRELVECTLIANVPRVQGRRRLEEQDLDFLIGDGPVFHASRHDEEIARPELDHLITQLHAKTAAVHEKELVFILVVMPHERTLKLRELHLLSIQLADDLRTPVIVECREL